MFIRKSTKKSKGKAYDSYVLVESVRTAKGPRQKTVCTLGDLKPRPRSEWLKLAHKIESSLAGQPDLLETQEPEISGIVEKIKQRQHKEEADREERTEKDEQWITVDVDGVETKHQREAGSVHVGYQYWKKLGLDEILSQMGLSKRSCELSCVMTMNRVVWPKSELAMPDWIRSTALSDIMGVGFEQLKEDSLYRNLDILHSKREVFESALVERERTLFNLDHTVFLYDITSTYFEGQSLKNPKAKRGYSRDKRPDCKQVLVGLVINREGFPIAHEVFEGNRQDRATVEEMLELLDKRVGLKKGQSVVVDRGMAFEENLAQIQRRNLHYLVASRQSERVDWLEEFEQAEGFEEVIRRASPRNPFQKKPVVRVKMKQNAQGSVVLCISSGRKGKDRAIRRKQEKKLVSDLEKLKKRIKNRRLVKTEKIAEAIGRLKERYPRVARYYWMEYDAEAGKLSYEIDEEKMTTAEELDGTYLLKTDRKDLCAEEIWSIYSLLTRAEDAFRSMKSPLMERPIFHQLQSRVETHIFLCVLAYHILAAIEKTLLDKGVHTSWATVREKLKTHTVNTIVLPTDNGSILEIRKASIPEPEQNLLYDLLDVPKTIVRPKKLWIQPEQNNL
jgi:transposase